MESEAFKKDLENSKYRTSLQIQQIYHELEITRALEMLHDALSGLPLHQPVNLSASTKLSFKDEDLQMVLVFSQEFWDEAYDESSHVITKHPKSFTKHFPHISYPVKIFLEIACERKESSWSELAFLIALGSSITPELEESLISRTNSFVIGAIKGQSLKEHESKNAIN